MTTAPLKRRLARARLLEHVTFALERREQSLTVAAVLDHRADDRTARLVVTDDDQPAIALPLSTDAVLLAGDSLVIPITVLQAVLSEVEHADGT